MTPTKNSIGCFLQIKDLPPSAFSLPDDGRKRAILCEQRKTLAVYLSGFAKPDGTDVFPSVEKLQQATGWCRSKVFRRLEDLRKLGFVSEQGWHPKYKTKIRKLDVSVVVPPVSDSPESPVSDSPNSGEAPVSDSPGLKPAPVSDSIPPVSDSRVTCVSLETPERNSERSSERQNKTHNGARVNSFSSWLAKEEAEPRTLDQALIHIPHRDMLASQWKRGEKEQAEELIKKHGWQTFVAVEQLYWQEQDPVTFAKTVFRWTALLTGFAGWLKKVTPAFLEEKAMERWRSSPEGRAFIEASVQRQIEENRKRWDKEEVEETGWADIMELSE